MSAFETETPSTRPYLIRALHEWCADNGFSPYIAVQVDASVRVPMEFVKNGEIVLNVSMDATSSLKLGNEFIEFKARFGGVAREIVVPVSHVIAIYARENGQGMAFPAPPVSTVACPTSPRKPTRRTAPHADRCGPCPAMARLPSRANSQTLHPPALGDPAAGPSSSGSSKILVPPL
jgi:stringent starvation protein B